MVLIGSVQAWATLIHQSRLPEAPGLTLREFAAASQGTSALVAARVLLNRIMFQGTARKQRKAYECVAITSHL